MRNTPRFRVVGKVDCSLVIIKKSLSVHHCDTLAAGPLLHCVLAQWELWSLWPCPRATIYCHSVRKEGMEHISKFLAKPFISRF